MKLIVGLGNPGRKYQKTRHNLGFRVVETLASELGLNWRRHKRFQAEIAKKAGLILVKPLTLMNNSGLAVKKIINFNNFNNFNNLYLVHDDVDLPLGRTKMVQGRGAAGHHGVESVIKHLGTNDFPRLRLGIGRPAVTQSGEDYVLSQLKPEEKPVAQKMIQEAVAILAKLEEKNLGLAK